MYNKVKALVFLFSFSIFCYPQEYKSMSIEDALVFLQSITIVEVPESGQIEAFKILYESSAPAENFNRLFLNADKPAGKFYGLLGLFQFDKDMYEKNVKALAISEVFTMKIYDTLEWGVSLNSLLSDIENGELIRVLTWQPE